MLQWAGQKKPSRIKVKKGLLVVLRDTTFITKRDTVLLLKGSREGNDQDQGKSITEIIIFIPLRKTNALIPAAKVIDFNGVITPNTTGLVFFLPKQNIYCLQLKVTLLNSVS